MMSPFLLWEKNSPRLGNPAFLSCVYLHAARQGQTKHTVKESINYYNIKSSNMEQ